MMASFMRYFAAIVGAALAAALLAGILLGNYAFAFYALFIALGSALFIGLPVALLFQWLGWMNAFAAIVAGFLIGAVPVFVMEAFSQAGAFVSLNGTTTEIDGHRTLAGWLFILQIAGILGVHGAVGGLTAWIIWRGSSRRPWVWAAAIAGAAVIFLGTPALMADRTCHNLMRYSQDTIAPQMRANIRLESSEWPALRRLFEDFATSNGWSFRDDSRGNGIQALFLSVCDAEGTLISAERDLFQDDPAFIRARGVKIGVYQPQGGSSWEAPMRRFLISIEGRWPRLLTFTDEVGQNIEPPAFLGRTPSHP
jgi:hypothetical protein